MMSIRCTVKSGVIRVPCAGPNRLVHQPSRNYAIKRCYDLRIGEQRLVFSTVRGEVTSSAAEGAVRFKQRRDPPWHSALARTSSSTRSLIQVPQTVPPGASTTRPEALCSPVCGPRHGARAPANLLEASWALASEARSPFLRTR